MSCLKESKRANLQSHSIAVKTQFYSAKSMWKIDTIAVEFLPSPDIESHREREDGWSARHYTLAAAAAPLGRRRRGVFLKFKEVIPKPTTIHSGWS